MDRDIKILLVLSLALVGSASLAVYFFTQGSIIGQPGTSQPCEWTATQTEDGETFEDFEVLNETLQDEFGDEWESFYDGTQVRVNPETGVIEDRLAGECSSSQFLDSGGSNE